MPETSQVITSMEPVSSHITGMEPKFYRAAVAGEIAVFREKSSGQIESMLTPNRNTILHIHLACCKVSEDFVSQILNMCHALLKKVNAKHETILHIAARYGHLEIVKIIIECANKDAPREDGEETLTKATNDKKDTALHEAVRYNHKKVVELLIKEDPNIGENNNKETPLYIAVERGYNEVIHTILEKSSSPNHRGPNGRTALHAAIVHFQKLGKLETLEELMSKIPSAMKEADEDGWVPLHLAATSRNPKLVEVLLCHDRNTAYMRDNNGRTALHFAAYYGNHRIMRKIIEHCPDCSELVDHKGRNALHYTTRPNEAGVPRSMAAEVIMEEQQLRNIQNEKDNEGNTPLHLLARYASTWKQNYNHPLLKENTIVDMMAFNKDNHTALDVAYDIVPSTSRRENFFLRQLRYKFGARFGGRVINENVKKKKQQKRGDSAITEKQKQENKEQEEDDDSKTQGRVRQTLLVVATLIATVTFTAGFTLPGGTIQDGKNKGSPMLMHDAAFKAFVITDSLSFVLSASAVFLQIFSSFVEKNEFFFISNRSSFLAALFLTMLGMVFMIAAFATATYAVLAPSKGLAFVTLLIALSFFFTFLFYLVYRHERSFHIWYIEREREDKRRSLRFQHEFSIIAGVDMQLLDSV